VPSVLLILTKGARLSEEDQNVLLFAFESFTGHSSSVILSVTHVDPEETVETAQQKFQELANVSLRRMISERCVVAVMEQSKSPLFVEPLKDLRISQLRHLQGLITNSKADAHPTPKRFSDFLVLWARALRRTFRNAEQMMFSFGLAEEHGLDLSFGQCPVCFDMLQMNNVAKLRCKHLMCEACVMKLVKALMLECPLCRANFSP